MLCVPSELLRGVPGNLFGDDVAEVVVLPAFIFIHAQAIIL